MIRFDSAFRVLFIWKQKVQQASHSFIAVYRRRRRRCRCRRSQGYDDGRGTNREQIVESSHENLSGKYRERFDKRKQ